MCHNKDLAEYGNALPLLFQFALFCMCAALVTTLVHSIYNFIRFHRDGRCDRSIQENLHDKCSTSFIMRLSLGNSNYEKVDTTERILFVVNFALLFLLKVYFLWKARSKDLFYDNKITSAGDYSIMIKGLRKDINVAEVTNYFEEMEVPVDSHGPGGEKEKIKVEKICYTFKLVYLMKYQSKIVNIRKEVIKEQNRKDKNLEKLRKLEGERVKLTKQVNRMKEEFIEGSQKEKGGFDKNFTGTAYVTFAKQSHAYYALQRLATKGVRKFFYDWFGPGCKCFGLKTLIQGCPVYINKAPEPNDILWGNLGLSSLNKSIRRLSGHLLSFLFMCITFCGLIGLKYFQVFAQENYGGIVRLLVLIAISGMINIINLLLAYLIRLVSELQRPESMTQFNISVATRVAFVFCF